jgi:hypothetical protein
VTERPVETGIFNNASHRKIRRGLPDSEVLLQIAFKYEINFITMTEDMLKIHRVHVYVVGKHTHCVPTGEMAGF